jgi:hypothetical protein
VPSASAIRSILSMLTLRLPRSTESMYVQWRLHTSASDS